MGLQTVPGFIGQASYNHPVELFRNILLAMFGTSSGRIRPDSFRITPTSNNREVSISAGFAYLVGVESSTQGGYFAWSNAAELQVFGTPSAQSRIDALVLRVIDTQYGSDPDSPKALFEIIAGTPAASPSPVADSTFVSGQSNYRPGAWFRLADVLITPTTTVLSASQITETYPDRSDYRLMDVVTYTSSGSFVKGNYSGLRRVKYKMVAAGGGSGGVKTGSGYAESGGGGAGAYAEGWIEVDELGTSETITVGSGGTGGAGSSASSGSTGGSTSIGSLISVAGGKGGSGDTSTTGNSICSGGLGGETYSGSLTPYLFVDGGDGGNGRTLSGYAVKAGHGGASYLSNRDRAATETTHTGWAGKDYGGGASSASTYNNGGSKSGGPGADGIVILELYS